MWSLGLIWFIFDCNDKFNVFVIVSRFPDVKR